MNDRFINIALVIVAVTLLGLLALRVRFDQLSGSGCPGVIRGGSVSK
jgi:hypothetical protein